MKLNLNNPCFESWNEMSDTNGGKFCDVCSKKREVKLVGVAGLEQGQELSLEPSNLERLKRGQH